MTESERVQALVTARMLRATLPVDWLGTGLTFIAMAGLLTGTVQPIFAIVAVLLGVTAKLYAFRIAFDARLFEDIGRGSVDLSALDDSLAALDLRARSSTLRPLPERCLGAKSLVVWLGAMTLLQALALILGALLA